jgi:hypothetical protein
MSQDCGTGEVVYCYEINLGVTQSCAENVATDTAETVNANLDCHACISPLRSCGVLLFSEYRIKQQFPGILDVRMTGFGSFGTQRGLSPNPTD